MAKNQRVKAVMDGRLKVVDDDVNLVFVSMFGHPARMADKAAVKMVGGDIDGLAGYLWKHWMGGPGHPTEKEVKKKVVEILTAAGNKTTEEDRW